MDPLIFFWIRLPVSYSFANITYLTRNRRNQFAVYVDFHKKVICTIVWRCVSRLENTGLFCDARTVQESDIEQVLVTAINQTLCDKNGFLSTLQDNITAVLSHESDTTLADIDKRLTELQAELLKLASSKADYEEVGDEIYRLREEKQKTLLQCANRDELRKRIDDMNAFLREQPTTLTKYDEPLVRRLIEKVTVYEDKFTVEFRSGVMVDVEE